MSEPQEYKPFVALPLRDCPLTTPNHQRYWMQNLLVLRNLKRVLTCAYIFDIPETNCVELEDGDIFSLDVSILTRARLNYDLNHGHWKDMVVMDHTRDFHMGLVDVV